MGIESIDAVVERLEDDTFRANLGLLPGVILALARKSAGEQVTPFLIATDEEVLYEIPISHYGLPLPRIYPILESLEKKRANLRHEEGGMVLEERDNTFQYTIKTQFDIPNWESVDEETRRKIQEEISEFSIRSFRHDIHTRHEYLEFLCEQLTPEIREDFKGRLSAAENFDSGLAERYQRKNYKTEKVTSASMSEEVWRRSLKLSNALTFGLLRRNTQRDLDIYSERAVVWKVIEDFGAEFAEGMQQDSRFLAREREGAMAKEISDLAAFYGNISYKAGYGYKKMKRLVEKTSQLYGSLGKLAVPELEFGVAKIKEALG